MAEPYYSKEELLYREWNQLKRSIPYDEKKTHEAFIKWSDEIKSHGRRKMASFVALRFAEEFPPEYWYSDGECWFCGFIGYDDPPQHEVDCWLVLFQYIIHDEVQ